MALRVAVRVGMVFGLAALGIVVPPDANDRVVSAGSGAVDPMVVALDPARLLETRTGPGLATVDGRFEGIGVVRAGDTLELQVVGRGGVPEASGAVFVNVTAIEPEGPGHLTVFQCDRDRPTASNLNYTGRDVVANNVFVQLSGDGAVCIHTHATTHLIADITAYTPSPGGPQRISRMGHYPERYLETRAGSGYRTFDGRFEGLGPIRAGDTVEVEIEGRKPGNLGLAGVFVNVTAIEPQAPGHLTIYPCDQTRPLASNLNYAPGDVVANNAFIRLGAGGAICIYTHATTHLVADVSRVVTEDSRLTALEPARLLETRTGPGLATTDGSFEGAGLLEGGDTLQLPVTSRAGVPAGSDGVFVNVTAIQPHGAGHLTVYPCDQRRPLASHLNYGPGDVVANNTYIKLSSNGDICIHTHATTHLIVDVTGYTTTDARALTTLDLSYNQLSSLPPEIGNLTNLTNLDLSVNPLSSLPPEIGNLANLTTLRLASTWLSSLPAEIGNLANLTYLHAGGDHWDSGRLTSLPAEIGNLANLTHLDLTRNHLTSLPPEIGNLTNLAYLGLSANNLTSLPAEIGNLTSLHTLHIGPLIPIVGRYPNQLTTLPPEIGNLANLHTFNLEHNELTSLPAEIGNLTNLTNLDLFANNLTSLPPEIGNLTNLTNLDLFGNDLSSLPPEIGNLTNLNGLELDGNDLSSLPAEFGNLTNLTLLRLEHNRLTSLPIGIGNLTNLTSLPLEYNELTSLPPEIGNLTNLISFPLDHNELTSLPPEIGNLTNLTNLDLFANNLTSLPPEIGNLTNLRRLNLLDNQLGDITAPMTALRLGATRRISLHLAGPGWSCPIITDPETRRWVSAQDDSWREYCS